MQYAGHKIVELEKSASQLPHSIWDPARCTNSEPRVLARSLRPVQCGRAEGQTPEALEGRTVDEERTMRSAETVRMNCMWLKPASM